MKNSLIPRNNINTQNIYITNTIHPDSNKKSNSSNKINNDCNNPFYTFAKGQQQLAAKTSDCVIYTRVSSLKQMDNLSLETQLKHTEQYARQKNLIVREYFGGTYESAKTDERKEFQRMIKFVKNTKHKISYILVYSLERFSRNDNSIWLAAELRKLGIEIVSVSQPMDTSNPAGQLQQNIMFLFGVHDNQLRRQKCMAGTKERLLKGEWCNHAPIGYDHIKVNGEKRIVVNATGKLIRKAFLWKANEDCSLTEIKRRLEKEGLTFRRIGLVSEILRNPFYCGIITHSALEGEIVEGKHEKLISKEIFLRVNKLYEDSAKHGYKVTIENDKLPLKRFIKCNECNSSLRGYINKKCGQAYYKCNNPGCKNNRNATIVHQQFIEELQHYTIDADIKELVQEQMTYTFEHLLEGQLENQKALQSKNRELQQKIEQLEERFVIGEITPDLYHKYLPKFKEELYQNGQELEKISVGGSNWRNAIEKAVNLCTELPSMWQQSTFSQKQKLQLLVFPEGMLYDRKNDLCRIITVNPVFEYVAHISRSLTNGNNEVKNICATFPAGSP